MTQDFAAPVIEQLDKPQKLKKHFCFATIPFILISFLGLYQSILQLFNFDWHHIKYSEYRMYTISQLVYLSSYLFVFIGALFIIVLLFAKQNTALLGVPLFMFSMSYPLCIVGSVLHNYFNYYTYYAYIVEDYYSEWFYEHTPTFFDYFKYSIPFCVLAFLAFLGFLAVTIYIFIVTARKKSAPKVLWIIPAVLFALFVLPLNIYNIFSNFVYIIESRYFNQLLYMPYNFIGIFFIVAIILLLIWISFPYKKNKVKKAKEVQPVPAAVPVMSPVTPPVMPAVQPEIKPAVQPATEPVVEKKPVDDDPERTIDYSYAEVFYPPVKAPETKPEAAAESEVKAEIEPDPKPPVQPAVNNDAETQRTNMQLLKEYKELLDGGVITQEDYDKKKNELLGL